MKTKTKQNNFTYLTFRIHFEHFSKKQTKKGKVIMEIEVGWEVFIVFSYF